MSTLADESPRKRFQRSPSSLSPSLFLSLPLDIVLNVLARVPKRYYPILCCVSKNLRSLVRSPDVYKTRSLLGKDSLYISFLDETYRPIYVYWYTLRRIENSTTENLFASIDFFYPPEPFLYHMIAVGPEIFFIPRSDEPSSSLWILDTRFGELRQGPSLLVKRRYNCVGLVGGKIYVIGGCRGDEIPAEVFDLKTQTWEAAPVSDEKDRQIWVLGANVSIDRKLAMLLWSYFSVVFTDPGVVPPNWRSAPDEEQRGESDSLNSLEFGGLQPDSSNQRTRFCRKCNQHKPPRCHHCSVCGRCVLKMDHHCVWVVNCVGALNYKYFLLFLLYTFLETTLVTLLLMPHFIAFFSDEEIPGTPGTLATTFLAFVLNLAFALSVMGFLIMHISLVAANTTTIEAYEKKTSPKWPYDLGRKKNFEQVFGMDKRYWLIPAYSEEDLRRMPELQGLEYPSKPDLIPKISEERCFLYCNNTLEMTETEKERTMK